MLCQICQRERRKIGFNTARIRICAECLALLNEGIPAVFAYAEVERKLRDQIMLDAMTDIGESQPAWRRARGERLMHNLDDEYRSRLPEWLNGRAAGPYPDAATKRLRAHRRGLLRRTERVNLTYPPDWAERAHAIRIEDRLQCVRCGARDVELQVHHIVYVSNNGTHRKANLATLCAACHQREHGRAFDAMEAQALPAPPPPPQPAPAPLPESAPAPRPVPKPAPAPATMRPPDPIAPIPMPVLRPTPPVKPPNNDLFWFVRIMIGIVMMLGVLKACA